MSLSDYLDALQDVRGFANTSASFYGFEAQLQGGLGRLPDGWVERYRADSKEFGVAYTVMSYKTPIAWVTYDETGNPQAVVIPNVHYSNTTTTQQNYCRKHLPFDNKRVTEL